MRTPKVMLCAVIMAALPYFQGAALAGGQDIELLRTGSYEQRLEAMLKAGFAGNKAAFYYLVENLLGERERVSSEHWRIRLRATAAESLGRLRDERAIPHLLARYGREKSPQVKRSILFALSFFKSGEADEVISGGLESEDEGVRFEAIRTAALSGSTVNTPALRKISAGSESERLRLAAAWALATLDDDAEKNVALLEDGLKSRDPESRFWSSIYLGEAGMPGSLEAVARAREIENMGWVRREMDLAVAKLAVMRKSLREKAEDERIDRMLERIMKKKSTEGAAEEGPGNGRDKGHGPS